MPHDTSRYSKNYASQLLKMPSPRVYLVESLATLIRGCPPQQPWASTFRNGGYAGFFAGPTSVAYLFFNLSKTHADLEIEGKLPADWLAAYLDLGQAEQAWDAQRCGVQNEFLCYRALKAAITQDTRYVQEMLEPLHDLQTDPGLDEWLFGRAGLLYVLRFVRHWVPQTAETIKAAMQQHIAHLLSKKHWVVFGGREFYGAVHGDIGIITQIVLSDRSYARKLEARLDSLLDGQTELGNWPTTPTHDHEMCQFCHGAPGFVPSLLALRPFYRAMQTRIDIAVLKARDYIWREGLLVKEPSLCHGISGNALALEGAQREHFMAGITPAKVGERQQEEAGEAKWVTEEAPSQRDQWGLYWGEAGRAWAWMVLDGGKPDGFPAYTDI